MTPTEAEQAKYCIISHDESYLCDVTNTGLHFARKAKPLTKRHADSLLARARHSGWDVGDLELVRYGVDYPLKSPATLPTARARIGEEMKAPTSENTTHDEFTYARPERSQLWRLVIELEDSLVEQIQQGHDADVIDYRAWLCNLEDEITASERAPSNRKLREVVEGHAKDAVWYWLKDRTDKRYQHYADVYLGLLRGHTASVADEHAKVMDEIAKDIGNTSRALDNIANRIVRKLYQD